MHVVLASLAFPLWIRLTHYINLLFIGLLIRSGIQIAGAHPRLYWNDGCNPDSAWLTLTKKKVPIELVADYSHLGEGQGGFREDYQFYGTSAEI